MEWKSTRHIRIGGDNNTHSRGSGPALEILVTAERYRSGGTFDRLVQEALDLLIEKILVAVRLARKPPLKLSEDRKERLPE